MRPSLFAYKWDDTIFIEKESAMEPYAVIDLHCDTLTSFMEPARCGHSLDDFCSALSLSNLPRGVKWGQCFAIFLPDGLTPEAAAEYYDYHQKSFVRQMELFCPQVVPCRSAPELEGAWAEGKSAAILTVENGCALAGDLARVELLARDGVRMMTLTWNGKNELGSGISTDHGLSPFGTAAVSAMEDQGILIDVSHLNDQGFSDLLQVAKKPFVASHSNARSVCPHRRNLTDDQIREMVDRRCLIGLNYYRMFLREDGCPTPDDLLRHVEHFLALGAEDCLALGSDFDGADLPAFLNSPVKAAGLYSLFLSHGFPPVLSDKILYGNALAFFRTNLRSRPLHCV